MLQKIKPCPKMKVYRSKKYLEFIRSKPCLVCGKSSQAHHVRRLYFGSGTAIKSHDFCTIPLCHACHDPKTEKNLNVERIIIDLMMEFIEERHCGYKKNKSETKQE